MSLNIKGYSLFLINTFKYLIKSIGVLVETIIPVTLFTKMATAAQRKAKTQSL